ncbi:ABC transporter permease [Variovorax sp. HJSM1_2]|uniref:ABC transporter permease n=1 Tax=Variovorax sp. HJSM1_2 TaxID=3366263 RepID=UPI003BC7100B
MSGYYSSILQGALLTVGVSLCAMLVAVCLGIVGAWAKLSGSKLLVAVGTAYTTIIRGIPDLVLMLLVFYGGSIAVNTLLEMAGSEATLDINPFAAGVVTLGFIYGAYMTETFRGAMLAIPHGQTEAAAAYGMTPRQTFVRITAPQMVRYALPGFTNNWLVMIKATALISLIGLQEMTYLAKQASAATRSPFAFFLFTAALFLVYTWVSLVVLRRLNAKYSLGNKRVSF